MPYAVRVANLPEPADPRHLCVSNADREHIAARLQRASAEGRLDLDELDQRLKAAYAARTFAELEPLTSDLPATAATGHEVQPVAGAARPTSRWGVALLGGFTRKGTWVVPRVFRSVTILGGGKIDLRHARLAEGEVTIRVFAFMGGVEIIVPPETHLRVNGIAIMGGWEQPDDDLDEDESVASGPRVTVTGFAIMGGAEVKRRPRRAK